MQVRSEAVGGGSTDEFRVTSAVKGDAKARSVGVPASDGDPSAVIARVQREKSGGANDGLVAAVRFPKDAMHVQLLRGYPKQYVRVMGAFLSRL
ncbi:hypothetical protein BCR44DRAFT_1425239 [Catenaria anguillulae PL171]|uniref:Uncharacterized protein n=1 Tax=Catenaria anguillulae PL171 TaxID=765915 RepID=A0A1Y2I0Y8_9FUNG|nr:hypothetical protein BCR44DRAFT_1425239 [Catenaria anguillulae PL171]